MTICDEEGKRLHTLEDIPALADKSFEALKRVHDAAMAVNGLTSEGAEEAEGNSDAAPGSDT